MSWRRGRVLLRKGQQEWRWLVRPAFTFQPIKGNCSPPPPWGVIGALGRSWEYTSNGAIPCHDDTVAHWFKPHTSLPPAQASQQRRTDPWQQRPWQQRVAQVRRPLVEKAHLCHSTLTGLSLPHPSLTLQTLGVGGVSLRPPPHQHRRSCITAPPSLIEWAVSIGHLALTRFSFLMWSAFPDRVTM